MLAYRGFQGEPLPRLIEIDVPTVTDRDVLVRIKSAGLTLGTFTLLKAGVLNPLPMTVGHEGAGVVEAVGRDVAGVKPGDRVRIHPTLSCGQCRACLTNRDQMCSGAAQMGFASFGKPVEMFQRYHNGFIAEYAVVPAAQIDHLPDHVSFDAGAKLHYMANAMRNLRVSELPPGGVLGILGATGAMAVATVRLAPVFGVSRIVLIGRSTQRLSEVQSISAVSTDVIAIDALSDDWAQTGALPQSLMQLTNGVGVDALIDYLPEGGPMWQAASAIAIGGTLVNMGGAAQPLGLPMRALVGRCLKVLGTRNHSRLDAKEVLRLMANGALATEDLITHRRPLAEVDAAVDALGQRLGSAWMSVVNP